MGFSCIPAPQYINCKRCGKTENIKLYAKTSSLYKLMRGDSLCFECATIVNRLSNLENNDHIVNGNLYRISFTSPSHAIGKPTNIDKYIINISTGEVFIVNESRLKLIIPKDLKPYFPSEFKFISKEAYEVIVSHTGKKCKAKGCFDRYHCIWYDRSIEALEAWNQIPEDYTIGSEGCPSFLEKSEVYDY